MEKFLCFIHFAQNTGQIFLHLKRNCIKRNAKVVNFETDKQKSMNELKKIIRLFKLTSRSKEKCAQTLLESEQYDV